MLAIVLGDLVRAWRPRLLGAAVGQPSAIHASMTSPKVASLWRRGWRLG
jgi:hypothetical protein